MTSGFYKEFLANPMIPTDLRGEEGGGVSGIKPDPSIKESHLVRLTLEFIFGEIFTSPKPSSHLKNTCAASSTRMLDFRRVPFATL